MISTNKLNSGIRGFLLMGFLFFTPIITKAFDVNPLFISDEVLMIEIRADFSSIEIDRTSNPKEYQGVLLYFSPEGTETRFNVTLTTRGKFRLQAENCSFPPLLINFRKSEVKNTIFEGQNKLKLVTPCREESDVLDEYTVYKMYNLISDLSFGVRLAVIKYFNSTNSSVMFRKLSFFIEDKDHVAERNGYKEYLKFLTPFNIEDDNYKKLSLFEYMIGNLDWSVVSRQNIDIFISEDSNLAPVAVPYDFDFSGFVDAHYTKPKDVPEELLTERRAFRGICYTPEELEEVFIFFRNLKPELEAVIRKQDLYKTAEKSVLLSYIRRFYRIINNPRLVRREFIENCQTRKDYNIEEN